MHSEYQLLKSVTVQTSDTELEWFKKSKWEFQSKITFVGNVVNIGAISVGSIMTFSNDKSCVFFKFEETLTHSLNSHPCLIYIRRAQKEAVTQQKRLFQRHCKRSINGCCHFSSSPQIWNRYFLYVKHGAWLWDEAMNLSDIISELDDVRVKWNLGRFTLKKF